MCACEGLIIHLQDYSSRNQSDNQDNYFATYPSSSLPTSRLLLTVLGFSGAFSLGAFLADFPPPFVLLFDGMVFFFIIELRCCALCNKHTAGHDDNSNPKNPSQRTSIYAMFSLRQSSRSLFESNT